MPARMTGLLHKAQFGLERLCSHSMACTAGRVQRSPVLRPSCIFGAAPFGSTGRYAAMPWRTCAYNFALYGAKLRVRSVQASVELGAEANTTTRAWPLAATASELQSWENTG